MFACSLGKHQLACSFIQLYTLQVPLFQHQHPSKYWAIPAQQEPCGAAHILMYYQEVNGKETVSGAVSFSFSCVGAVPSQSAPASITPTIPNIESPRTDSSFVHVFLLQVPPHISNINFYHNPARFLCYTKQYQDSAFISQGKDN